jgi:hypothetical protein
MSRLVLLLLPLLAAGAARADIYQWTDANGRVHFGDSAAGAGQPAKTIAPPKVKSPSGGSGGAPGATTGDAARRDRLERVRAANEADRRAAEEAEREKEREQRRKESMRGDCQRLRDELAAMEGRPVYVTGDDGERQYLDDTQRRAYVDKAEQALREHCQ